MKICALEELKELMACFPSEIKQDFEWAWQWAKDVD